MTAMLVTLAAASLTLGGVINAAHTHNTAAAYPELRPEFGKYQEIWKVSLSVLKGLRFTSAFADVAWYVP